MVWIVKSLLATCAFTAAATTSSTASAVAALKPSDYYRPTGSIVSGVPGTTAAYRRAPCPALNSLANHGCLPRNDQNITHAVLSGSLMSIYNLGSDLAAALVSQVPETFDLDLLGTHNFIEHDASLVHLDSYYGRPPTEMNLVLAADMLSRTNTQGSIGFSKVGKARKDRLATCKSNNPNCTFGTSQASNVFAEATALVAIMDGRSNNDTISVAHARSFLVEERIPSNYKKPANAVTLVDLSTYLGKIAAFAI